MYQLIVVIGWTKTTQVGWYTLKIWYALKTIMFAIEYSYFKFYCYWILFSQCKMKRILHVIQGCEWPHSPPYLFAMLGQTPTSLPVAQSALATLLRSPLVLHSSPCLFIFLFKCCIRAWIAGDWPQWHPWPCPCLLASLGMSTIANPGIRAPSSYVGPRQPWTALL